MAFFLLGRSGDDTLALLSDRTFESRQDALAELGRITATPEYDRWDDEVVLIDIESGTPVLLVRPNAPAPAEPAAPESAVPEDETDREPAAFAVLADEITPVEETEPEVAETAEIEEPRPFESVDVEPLVLVDVEESVPAAVFELEPVEPLGAISAPPAVTADLAFVEEVQIDEPLSSEVIPTEPVIAETPVETASDIEEIFLAPSMSEEPAAPEGDAEVEVPGLVGLREAIARTTEQMEASGIVAPASIGPAEGAEAESQQEPEPLEDAPLAEPEVLAPDVPEPEMPAWPWATESDESSVQLVTTTDEPEVDEPKPEVEGPEPDVALVLEGLEEPALDGGGSLISSTMDDADLAASRPVILGAYDESPLVDLDEAEAVVPPAEGVPATGDESDSDEVVVPPADSDFIMLDPGPPTPTADAGAESTDPKPADENASEASKPHEVGEGPLSVYTCNDCVYVDTCPNKDQRLPEDCGSFQWK